MIHALASFLVGPWFEPMTKVHGFLVSLYFLSLVFVKLSIFDPKNFCNLKAHPRNSFFKEEKEEDEKELEFI